MRQNSNQDKGLNIDKSHLNSDLETFNGLFHTHYNLLFNYVLKLSHNQEIAKDVVQEAYIKLWENRDKINHNLCLENYLFKICHNEFLLYIRKSKKEKSVLDELKYQIAYETYSSFNVINEKEENLKKAIEKIPKRAKEAFILSKYENFKYAEIAVKMNISVKTVEKHISKALNIIKENVLFLFI